MEPTLRAVLCPCCRNLLYALEMAHAKDKASWTLAKGSPAIQADPEGDFLRCPRCSKRVALEKNPSGSGLEWGLAAIQKCN